MQRGTVQDMMAFMAKTVSERTQPTQRQSIQENNFTAHVHARPAVDGISGVLVSDSEYPVRVAFSLLNKLLEEFLMKVPKSSWQAQAMEIASTGSIPSKGDGIVRTSDFPFAQDYLARYQDPRQADTILRVQQELDDTKIVLHNTIDSVLQRGEDLDKLVEKSGSLSQQSKMFYKSAKKVRMSVFMWRFASLSVCVHTYYLQQSALSSCASFVQVHTNTLVQIRAAVSCSATRWLCKYFLLNVCSASKQPMGRDGRPTIFCMGYIYSAGILCMVYPNFVRPSVETAFAHSQYAPTRG